MPLPLSISYRKRSKRPEAGAARIRRLPRIRMVPLPSKEEETGGQAQMETLPEDQMGDTESPQTRLVGTVVPVLDASWVATATRITTTRRPQHDSRTKHHALWYIPQRAWSPQ